MADEEDRRELRGLRCDSIPVHLTRSVIAEALERDRDLTVGDIAHWLDMRQVDFERAFLGKAKAGRVKRRVNGNQREPADDRAGACPERAARLLTASYRRIVWDGGAVEMSAVRRLVAARSAGCNCVSASEAAFTSQPGGFPAGSSVARRIASWAVDPSDQSIFPFRRATQNQVHPLPRRSPRISWRATSTGPRGVAMIAGSERLRIAGPVACARERSQAGGFRAV